jgi:hypothetical protein
MNFHVRLLADTRPEFKQRTQIRIAYGLDSAELTLASLRDYKYFSNVRCHTEQTFNALQKACRAGVFGRGSLGRFHLLFCYKDFVSLIPVFTKSGRGGIWLPNYDAASGCMSAPVDGPYVVMTTKQLIKESDGLTTDIL